MEKIFISYHHALDQVYKDELARLGHAHQLFQDCSVSVGDISDDLESETIRRKIRDEYLRDSTVTVLLVGKETANRKHVDWELKSSMIDGERNKRSGILVVNLPSVSSLYYNVSYPGEKDLLYPNDGPLITITNRAEYERRYPYMPARIIDNLLKERCWISVVSWQRIAENPGHLKFLIDSAAGYRHVCEYDLSRTMRRYNS